MIRLAIQALLSVAFVSAIISMLILESWSGFSGEYGRPLVFAFLAQAANLLVYLAVEVCEKRAKRRGLKR